MYFGSLKEYVKLELEVNDHTDSYSHKNELG